MIRGVILHFWLAYDHPFVDGNGRTARALFYWQMLHSGYWLFEFISISQILRKSPVAYGTVDLEERGLLTQGKSGRALAFVAPPDLKARLQKK